MRARLKHAILLSTLALAANATLVVGTALADSAKPMTLHVSHSGMHATLAIDWEWPKCDPDRLVGYAVSWGDEDSGVHARLSGDWGLFASATATDAGPCATADNPITGLDHTYATAGDHTICVVMVHGRDGKDESFDITKNKDAEGLCTEVTTSRPSREYTVTPVVTPTPTPAAPAATPTPVVEPAASEAPTLPPTDAFAQAGSASRTDIGLALVLLTALSAFVALVALPARRRASKR